MESNARFLMIFRVNRNLESRMTHTGVVKKRAGVQPLFSGARERSQETWEKQQTNFPLGVQTARRNKEKWGPF